MKISKNCNYIGCERGDYKYKGVICYVLSVWIYFIVLFCKEKFE